MSLIAVNLPCFAGGRSVITLNMCAAQVGSNVDKQQYRIVRRDPWGNDAVLIGTPQLTMRGDGDVRSWTWIDDGVPHTAAYTYRLQINRLTGTGIINELVLLGQHFKR